MDSRGHIASGPPLLSFALGIFGSCFKSLIVVGDFACIVQPHGLQEDAQDGVMVSFPKPAWSGVEPELLKSSRSMQVLHIWRLV